MPAMDPDPATIDSATFSALLARYPSLLPAKILSLDAKRYDSIPAALAARKQDKHLFPAEALALVDWKLSHGTFRPRLRALVEGNADIEAVTREAYALLPAHGGADEATVAAAMKVLSRLKGVGPATASLLLAVAEPSVPFFSDEVFLWTGGDWGGKIGYTPKEYVGLISRVRTVAERLGVPVVEVERVAWVIGRERKEAKGKGVKGAKEEKAKEEKEVEAKEVQGEDEVKITKKRKAAGEDVHQGRRTRSMTEKH